MKSPKQKYAECPCCLSPRYATEMITCIKLLEKIERAEYRHYKELNIDTYQSFINNNFEWACDFCLEDKKAIIANPGLQNYTGYPNLAYSDKAKICRTCEEKFTFTKEEKQHWYEKLKFWVDSEPVNCKLCRREMRHLKAENKVMSEILKKEEKNISIEELESVVEIYRKWNKPGKAKYFGAILRKRNSGPGHYKR